MFREMRRIGQQLPADETLSLLQSADTAVLGVQGDDGYPYTVPVNFVYADGKVYIHCAKSGHKLDAIRANDKISLCVIGQDAVVPATLSTDYKSAVLFGRARVLEDETEIFHAVELLGLKYNSDREAVDREIRAAMPALGCIEITVEHLTGKEGLALSKRRNRA
jgi:hypothetical protein